LYGHFKHSSKYLLLCSVEERKSRNDFKKKFFADLSHLSFFSRKEIKVFDENIPGFSPYNGLHWEANGSRFKWFQFQLQRALNDTRQ